MRKVVMILAVLVVFANVSYSSYEKKVLTVKDMLSFKRISQLSLSPFDSKIAFVVKEPDFEKSKYNQDIWVVDVFKKKTFKFAFSSENEINPLWSSDGGYLAFLSDRGIREDKEDDEEELKNQIWIIPTNGGEAQKLTSAEMGVLDYRWMPDGKKIVYLTLESLSSAQKKKKKMDKEKKFDVTIVDKEKYKKEFWEIDLKNKDSKKIFVGDYGISEFEVSPCAEKIVYSTNYSGEENDYTEFDLWVLSLKTKKTSQLTFRKGAEEGPLWSPDGERIAFIAPFDSSLSFSQPDIWIIDSNDENLKNLTLGFDRCVDEIEWSKDGKYIYFVAEDKTNNLIYRISLRDKKIKEVISGKKFCYDMRLGKEKIAFVSGDSVSTFEVFCSTLKGKRMTKLTDLNPHLKDFYINPQEVISWRSTDGWEIEGLLVKPYNFSEGIKYPMIVFVHGGPFGRVGNYFLSVSCQYYASYGYVVFAPNFRGSSGYTNEFGVANKGDLGGGDFQDIMSGIDYVISLGFVDPEKIGITGGSYGGFLVNWAITQTDRFKAAVSEFGIFDFKSDYGNTYISRWDREYLGAYYWENMEPYKRFSPSTYVQNVKTPVLILHGDEDPNCFISSSKELYRALKDLGQTVEFVRYPREEHGFSELNHIVDEEERIIYWFDKYLKKTKEVFLGEKKPKIGQEVKWDEKILKVENMDVVDSYFGVKPKGKFLEVEFFISGKREKDFSINFDQDIFLFTKDYEKILISGIPQDTGEGKKILLTGDGLSVSIKKSQTQELFKNIYRVVFDVDKNLHFAEFSLNRFPKIELEF